jgi:hypothetical protein
MPKTAKEYRERAARARELAEMAKPSLVPALLRLAADYAKAAENLERETEQKPKQGDL